MHKLSKLTMVMAVVVAVTAATAAELRVPEDYKKIGEAIVAAAPGDVILIAPGKYRENLTISRRELTLRGEAASLVVIEAETPDAPVVLIRARNVTLLGLTLSGGQQGVNVEARADNALLSDLIITRNQGEGLRVEGVRGGELKNSVVTGNGAAGVFVGSRSTFVLRRNRITENAVGIEAFDVDALEMTENEIEGNRGCGLRTDERSTGQFRGSDNVIRRNSEDLCAAAVRLQTLLDHTPPPAPIALRVAPDGWTNQGRFAVDWENPQDVAGIAAYWFKVGTAPTSLTDGSRRPITEKPLILENPPEGEQPVFVWLEDGMGNKTHLNVSSVTMRFDKTPPTVRITLDPASPDGKNGWYTKPVSVRYECSDALSGLDPATPCPPATNLTTDGVHTLTLGPIRDRAGNVAHAVPVTVKFDATPPRVTWQVPDQGVWYRDDVSVPCTAWDATSGLANPVDADFALVARGEGKAVSTGTRTVADEAGNTITVGPFTFQIDKSPPTISYTLDPEPNAHGWHKTDVTVRFRFDDPLSGITAFGPEEPVVVTGEGRDLIVKATATDRVGWVATREVRVCIDRTSPTIELGSPQGVLGKEGWYRTAVTVPYTARDELSGFAGGVSSQAGTVVTSGEGSDRTVVVRLQDLAGNEIEAIAGPFKVDMTPPTAQILLDPPTPNGNNGWYTRPVTVRYESSDVLSGLDPSTPCPPQQILTEDKTYILTLTVADKAGNSVRHEVTVKLDRTPPIIVATPPDLTRWYREDVSVPCTASDATSGLANPADASFVLVARGEGKAVSTETRTVLDEAGNAGTVGPFSFQIDKTPPVLRILPSPAAPDGKNGWYTQPVTVEYECTDTLSGIDPLIQCPPRTVLTADGEHRLGLGPIQDRAGNIAEPVTLTIRLDRTPPIIVATPPDLTRWYREDVSVSCTASDATSGLANPADASFALVARGEGRAVSTGARTVEDQAGNIATVGPYTFQIDQTPPRIWAELSPRPNAAGWNNSDVVVTFRCEDALSGCASWSPPQTVTREGRTTVEGVGQDSAGVVGRSTLEVRIDKTPPTLTLTIAGLVTEGFETGDLSPLPWRTGGDARWFVQRQVVRTGNWAAQAGRIGDNRRTWLEITANMASGTITFAYRASSESGYDYLRFYVDGVERGKWSGETGWQVASFSISSGIHTLRWEYTKDGSVSSGQDTVWLDNIALPVISPGQNLPVDSHTVVLHVTAHDGLSGVADMRFSNDGRIWSPWEKFATVREGWDVSAAGGSVIPGPRTVFAQVRDGAGNVSPAVQAAITLATVVVSAHGKAVWSVAFSKDGRYLVTGSEDAIVKLWGLRGGGGPLELTGHAGPVYSVTFSPDSSFIATASADRTIRVWEVESGKLARTLTGHDGPVRAIAFSHDGKILASASDDRTVRLWRVDTGESLCVLRGHTDRVRSVVFHPNGTRVISGSDDGTVRRWGLSWCGMEWEFKGHVASVHSVAVSPDGTLVASGSWDDTIKAWDFWQGRDLRTLEGHRGDVNAVSFSPDGRLLASASDDRTIRLWSVASWQEIVSLTGHNDWVLSVAFSSDGKYLASGSRDGVLRLWDLQALGVN